MEILRYILMGIFVLVCIVATVLVLLQEGRSQGLGAIAGAAESYWGKNKGRSKEAYLVIATAICLVIFLGLALLLGSKWMN